LKYYNKHDILKQNKGDNMSLDYSSLLTADQKRKLLEGRIQQFASEAYQYTLNLKTAEELGSEDQLEGIKKSIDVLETAIKIHQEELLKLPVPETE
jgi:molecular chaperone DnaK (HSP70)